MLKKIQTYFAEVLPNGILFIKKSAIAKNATSLYVIQIAEYLVPLIMIPYVVRVIGPAGLGKAAFCQGLVGYFAMLVDYGFALSATRSISVNRGNKEKINKIFTSTIGSKIILFLSGLIILFFLTLISSKIREYRILMFAAYLAIVGNVISPLWLFQGLENMTFLSIANIGMKIIMVAGIFIFVRKENGILAYILIPSLAQIIYGLTTFLKAKTHFGISLIKIGYRDIVHSLKEGWMLFWASASYGLYSAGNPFILGFFVSPTIVGYYSGAEKIVRTTLGLITPISQAVYPRFSKLAVESREEFFRWAKKLVVLMGSIGFLISCGIFILAPLAVKIILGPNFGPSILLIRILSPIPCVVAIGAILGTQIMIPMKKDREFTKILLMAGVINFGIVYFLARNIGASASAIALLSAEFYVMFSTLMFVNFKIRRGTSKFNVIQNEAR